MNLDQSLDDHPMKKDDMPRFVLVEVAQLEKLLQHCPLCGRLPSGKQTGKPRHIEWTKKGTNLTAITRYACNNDIKHRWPCQSYIPNTETRVENHALVTAAMVAPAAGIAMVSKQSFIEIAKNYSYQAIEDKYYRQQSDLFRSIPDSMEVSMDGAYDSPGYSAEYCSVAVIEDHTHHVLDFSITHKSETENVSGRMELAGVKKCLNEIQKKKIIDDVTVDKHPQTVSYLKKQNIPYHFGSISF